MTNPSENTTEEQESKPGYYAIIPANVRYCKELPPCARLLYGEITALSNKEGYCWAKNEYFADLYDVEVRTIVNWLEALKNLGFIFVDTEKKGFQWKRKIWISLEVKESFTKGKKFPFEEKKNSFRREKNNPSYNSTNTTSNKTSSSSQKTASPDDDLVFTDTEKEDLNNYSSDQIAEALKRTKEKCGCPNNSSRVKFFFTVIARLKEKPKPKPKLTPYEILSKQFKDGQTYYGNNCSRLCFISKTGIGFASPLGHDQVDFTFDKFFSWDKFDAFCKQFNIKYTKEPE